MSITTTRSGCPLDCPDGCSLELTLVDGRIESIDGSDANPLTDGFICGKVRRMSKHVYGPERLLSPMLRRGPKGQGLFEPLEWDEALDLAVAKLLEVRDRAGGEAILPLGYGGSNGLLTQHTLDARLFARLGASVLERRVCAAPTSTAAAGLYGWMHGVTYPDYAEAELIVLWGVNPNSSSIHLVPHLNRALARGAQLVVIDPRRTPLARRAHLHLALRPGTDLCLALALIRELFETGGADEAFLSEHTTGADELRRRAGAWTLERAAETAQVPREDLAALAGLYAQSSPALIRCGWGLERNRNGGSAAAAILALPAVGGKFGLRGGGYTMSNGRAWALDAGAAGEPYPAQARRVNLVQAGAALTGAVDPRVELAFVYNGNPLATVPDQNAVRRGLEREDLFTIVFDAVLTDTARYADLLLPATTFLEHDELHSPYGSTHLLRIRPAIAPVGLARSNLEVFGELCRRTGVAREGDLYDTEDLARAIVASHPRAAEVQAALDRDGIAALPGPEHPVQFVDVFPATPDRKVHLVPAALDREAPLGLYGFAPDPGSERYPLALISPSLARLTNSTFGQLMETEARVELHPDDAAARGISDGDEVRIESALGEVRCLAGLSRDLRPGVVLLPKGLWERHTRGGGTASALAPASLTDLGRGACYNDARVEVRRA